MQTEDNFYVCLTCLEIVEDLGEHREHRIILYPGYPAGHEQLKPPTDRQGNLKSRLPRWVMAGLKPYNPSLAPL